MSRSRSYYHKDLGGDYTIRLQGSITSHPYYAFITPQQKPYKYNKSPINRTRAADMTVSVL